MKIISTHGWDEYELMDSGRGNRFERFGPHTIIRPDPQAIWNPLLPEAQWKADFNFSKQENGKEAWGNPTNLPTQWKMSYKDLKFIAKLSPFKHTGVFPEQHLMWDFIDEKTRNAGREINVLNLFAYTGIATLAAANAGAKVTHVDASRPSITWARENQDLSGLSDKPIRWILDDAIKFTSREVKRGVKYDAIIMDPPVYGHGPEGEIWDFNKSFPELLTVCRQVLSDNPLFIIVNAYAISASSIMLKNILEDFNLDGTIEHGELALQQKNSDRLLSTGIFARWSV
jgi:23S rRNA (cytosine1962-C5)-methyltransferase